MKLSNIVRASGILVLVALIAIAVWVGRREPTAAPEAQAPPQQASAQAPAADAVQADPNQRSLQIYTFKKAALEGVDRGREIFYYKCWFCHNEFAGPQSAPDLSTVYKREKLMSGRPTTDEGIKEEIREGGEGMAAYKYTLTDQDLNDLISYIREACCWNSDAPPPNPRFIVE